MQRICSINNLICMILVGKCTIFVLHPIPNYFLAHVLDVKGHLSSKQLFLFHADCLLLDLRLVVRLPGQLLYSATVCCRPEQWLISMSEWGLVLSHTYRPFTNKLLIDSGVSGAGMIQSCRSTHGPTGNSVHTSGDKPHPICLDFTLRVQDG